MPGTMNTPAPVTAGGFNPLVDLDDDHDPTPAIPVAAPQAPTALPAAAAEPDPGTKAGPAGAADPSEESDPAEEAGTDDRQRERDRTLAKYAARRRHYTLAVVVLVIIAIWLVKPWTSLNIPGTSDGPDVKSTSQEAKPAGDPVKHDMARIHKKLKASGDLTDLKLPGALVAAAGTSLYASRTVDSQCVVYGVAHGKDIEPQADSTGQACEPSMMKQVQDQLDTTDADQRAATVDKVESKLKSAADTAKFYAGRTYDSGKPTLDGLTSDNLQGVRISSNHGDWAKLTAHSGHTCRTAIVAATGELGEITTC